MGTAALNYLADFIIAFLELLEAEGLTLRRAFFRLGLALALALGAGIFLVAGFALMLYACYSYLQNVQGAVVASLLTGTLALLVGLLFLWIAKRASR